MSNAGDRSTSPPRGVTTTDGVAATAYPTGGAAGQTAAPRSGRGCRNCLLGCLGMVVVTTVVVVAGAWFGYTRYLRPWWLETREQIYANFPQLEAIEGMVLGEDGPAGFSRGAAGSSDRADFPADVALPDASVRLTTRTSETRALAVAEVRGVSVESLADAIRSRMRSLGWNRVTVSDPGDGIALRFERDAGESSRVAAYEVLPKADGLVRVWVRVTRAGADPPRSEAR